MELTVLNDLLKTICNDLGYTSCLQGLTGAMFGWLECEGYIKKNGDAFDVTGKGIGIGIQPGCDSDQLVGTQSVFRFLSEHFDDILEFEKAAWTKVSCPCLPPSLLHR